MLARTTRRTAPKVEEVEWKVAGKVAPQIEQVILTVEVRLVTAVAIVLPGRGYNSESDGTTESPRGIAPW